jgi:hypothetical protein
MKVMVTEPAGKGKTKSGKGETHMWRRLTPRQRSLRVAEYSLTRWGTEDFPHIHRRYEVQGRVAGPAPREREMVERLYGPAGSGVDRRRPVRPEQAESQEPIPFVVGESANRGLGQNVIQL